MLLRHCRTLLLEREDISVRNKGIDDVWMTLFGMQISFFVVRNRKGSL